MKRFVDLDSAAQYNIFNAVKELKESGLGYKRIIKKLREEKEINLSLGTLSYWFNNNVKMVGGENYFETKPSRELSYVLGVLFGDGSLSLDKRKQEYKIRLDAIDYDFVEKFSASVSKLLGKERYYSICYPKKKIYSTQIQSKQLYYFIKSIKENFDKGKPFIETYPAEFIMGLADSEGTSSFSPKTSWINVVVAHSANLALLRYVKWLLFEKFGVQSKLRRVKTAGMRDSVIDGRIIERTMDIYALGFSNMTEITKFARFVGFSLNRKKQKLEDAIFLLEKYERHKAGFLWEQIYHKEGKFWVRNNKMPIDELNFVN